MWWTEQALHVSGVCVRGEEAGAQIGVQLPQGPVAGAQTRSPVPMHVALPRGRPLSPHHYKQLPLAGQPRKTTPPPSLLSPQSACPSLTPYPLILPSVIGNLHDPLGCSTPPSCSDSGFAISWQALSGAPLIPLSLTHFSSLFLHSTPTPSRMSLPTPTPSYDSSNGSHLSLTKTHTSYSGREALCDLTPPSSRSYHPPLPFSHLYLPRRWLCRVSSYLRAFALAVLSTWKALPEIFAWFASAPHSGVTSSEVFPDHCPATHPAPSPLLPKCPSTHYSLICFSPQPISFYGRLFPYLGSVIPPGRNLPEAGNSRHQVGPQYRIVEC